MKRFRNLVLSFMTISIMLAGCGGPEEVTAVEETKTAVEMKVAQSASIKSELVYAGQVKPNETVNVTSKISGQVSNVNFDVGDTVKAGDVMFTLDQKDIQDQIKQLNAQLNVSNASVKSARTNLAHASGAQSETQELSLKTAVENAKDAKENAQVQLKNADVAIKNAQTNIEGSKTGIKNAENSIESSKISLESTGISLESSKISLENAEIGVDNAKIAIENAKIGVDNAKATLDKATEKYENMKVLYNAGTVTKNDFDSTELAYTQAQKGYEQAQKTSEQAQKGYEQAQKSYEQAQKSYEQAQKGYEQAQKAYEQTQNGLEKSQQAYEQTQNALEQAQNSKSQAEIGIKQAETAYNQAKDNHDIYVNKTTGENRETAQDGVNSAVASRESVQTQIDILQSTLKDTSVKAPISGVITTKNISKTNMVSAQSAPFVIVDMSKVTVDVNVSEKIINIIKQGDVVDVTIPTIGDTDMKGVVKTITPSADQTNTYPVKIEINNANGIIKPGMFAEIHFVESVKFDTIVVPRNTVLESAESKYVYVLENNKAVKRDVETGIDNGDEIEIVSGVSFGEAIIVKGQSYVNDGEEVNVVGSGSDSENTDENAQKENAQEETSQQENTQEENSQEESSQGNNGGENNIAAGLAAIADINKTDNAGGKEE